MGEYYRKGSLAVEGNRFICNCCDFRTDSFMGIQSHIRVHRQLIESKKKGQQKLIDNG